VHALGNPHRCFDKKFEVCLCEIQIKLDSFAQYVTDTVDTEANQHLFLNSSHSRDVSHLLGLHEFFYLHGVKSKVRKAIWLVLLRTDLSKHLVACDTNT
jgi:hypothetical protein